MRDITLGQFYPGDSVLHRMDPRAKLILLVLYITVTFIASSAGAFALVIAVTVTMMILSRIPLRVYLRGMRPILFVIIFTTLINIFMTRGETPLFEAWIFRIYKEGLMSALLVIMRVSLLVLGSGIFLTYTTSPISLTDGLETLLAPLKKIHVPVHEFSMMMTIALRFIPTLIEETDKIMSAQKARGADFSSGGLIARAKALLPVMIPLFVSAFKRADELAIAMECRCYRGGEGRTRMKILRYGSLDIAIMICGVLFAALVIAINIRFPLYRLKR